MVLAVAWLVLLLVEILLSIILLINGYTFLRGGFSFKVARTAVPA